MDENERRKQAEELVERIKELVKKGNIARIVIKKDGRTIVDLPLNIGVIGGVVGLATAPWAMLIASIVTIGTDCQVELHTVDGSILDISGKTISEKILNNKNEDPIG